MAAGGGALFEPYEPGAGRRGSASIGVRPAGGEDVPALARIAQARDVFVPGCSFTGGVGLLFRLDLGSRT